MKKDEMCQWMADMLPNDKEYLCQSGASYDSEIRELEAALRPMWGIFPLLYQKRGIGKAEQCLERLLNMIRKRRLPEITVLRRQIIVEAGVLAYGIGIFGTWFLEQLDGKDREYLVQWLYSVNEVSVSENNWLFFYILINGALKVNGFKYSEQRLEEGLKKINSFYLGEGWYSDGRTHQRDYYVAFAFHFYGLIYARMFSDRQAEVFISRARRFAEDYIYWFDSEGRSLPFGRSLTYRFAHVCFWCNFVLSGAYKGTDLTLGVIKGIISRNLEFWKRLPIRQAKEDNLSIGYGYGNLLLSEDYNAPGSPMWAFKSFIILELPDSHEFWKCKAEPYPALMERTVQPFGGFQGVVSKNGHHHVLLSSDQYSASRFLYHNQEKYGKFAYSTYFGFNLTRDVRYIRQFAVDSALAVSIKGYEQYSAREEIKASRMYELYSVSWWKTGAVSVCSYLIPVSNDIHIRIHDIYCEAPADLYEGGFPLFNWNKKFFEPELTDMGVRLSNQYGVSQIVDLTGGREPVAIQQGPNTNIYSCEPNGIPALHCLLDPGPHTLACAVCGIPITGENEACGVPGEKNGNDMENICLMNTDEGWVVEVMENRIQIKKELVLLQGGIDA